MRNCRRILQARGFTLLEMLAILAVIALVMSMTAPLLRPPHGELALETSAHQLCAALRSARAHAIAGNRSVDLTIDLQRRTYWTPYSSETALPPHAQINLTIAGEKAVGNRGALAFYPGGASSGGEILISEGNSTALITVGWITGEAACGT